MVSGWLKGRFGDAKCFCAGFGCLGVLILPGGAARGRGWLPYEWWDSCFINLLYFNVFIRKQTTYIERTRVRPLLYCTSR